MKRGFLATAFSIGIAAATAASAQVIDLSQPGPAGTAIEWIGDKVNARAGTSILRADMSGDVDREDLVVGLPGAGPNGEGQAYVIFMGPPRSGLVTLISSANGILTGEAAGDRFGAALAAGMIIRREVQPLPPRDLVVAAPAAFGGRGAVYLFPGRFTGTDSRSAAAAPFRVLGAAGDQLGASLIATDIDGDGYRDIVMSAPGSGHIYVIFGGPSLTGTRDLSTQTADVTMTLPAMPVKFASADFNNDGFKDLAVGAPSAASGAGTVYVLNGRARSAFSTSFSLNAAATVLTGIGATDAAGAAVVAADFDGDGVRDLVITAPGGDGPGNARPDAGEAYVFWGGTHFSLAGGLAAANVTIYGAAPDDRLGSAASDGHIRRDLPSDLLLVAAGASASGDIDVVYGRQRNALRGAIDLADGIDRVLRGDPASAALESVVSMPVTGKGDDIIAVAAAASAGGNSGAGALFVAYSPTLVPNPLDVSVTVAQGSTANVVVTMSNVGTLNIPWAVRSNTAWLAVSPETAASSAAAQGQFTLTIKPGNLAPGAYRGGYSFVSLSRDLAWPASAAVNLTVTPGTITTPTPPNPFGVPDPSDEGSPNGVTTQVGSNVQTLPVRDVLVTFAGITTPGNTHVDVVSNPRGGNGAVWSPWEFRIWTTAAYTGPVTIGIAYDSALAATPGAIRIWDEAGKAAMQASDPVKHLLFAKVARLPVNVTVENTPNTDFNDDGHPDLVWQNDSTRQVTAWYMGGVQGATFLNGGWLSLIPVPGWRVVATKDFNGDGHPDLLWQNDQTRQVVVWYMGGAQGNVMQAWMNLSPGVPGWRVVAVADFDGDGHPDLVWQHDQSRAVVVWYMTGAQGITRRDWKYASAAGAPGWRVAAVADLDGDGHPDLIWQNDTTRQVVAWYMSGALSDVRLRLDYISIASVPGWTVVGAIDFDGDGRPDIVWQNDATRQVVVWYMGGPQGATRLGLDYLSRSGVAGWRTVMK
jgi:hypothetical protein